MILLTIRQPGKPDRRVETEGDSVLLGRHETCDVVIQEGYISNHHLRIMRGIVVLDQKSRNGSYLEGQRLDRPALLQAGERLTLGKEKLTLEVEYQAPMGSAPPTLAQGSPGVPGEETWQQGAPKSADLRGQLSELQDQKRAWQASERERAGKDAELRVQLEHQAEALRAKDQELEILRARLRAAEA